MVLGQSVVFLLSALATVSLVNGDLEVQLLHAVFRHGDKVPHKEYQNYPNDPHRNHSYHPHGNGDLTNTGKMREYRIGTMLRERYDRYFGPDYWPAKIYARSTDVPRTQLSLQLVLAGLFPPSERQTWNPRLPWIPAWTFFMLHEMDNVLSPTYCPRYKEEYSRFLELESTREILAKYKNVMDYLTEHTGKLVDTSSAVGYLYNLFNEEAAQNLTLPEWTRNVYPEPMKQILALDFQLRSYTKTLRRLNGGMLLRKVIDDIQARREGRLEPEDRKAFLFSAHEMNVAAFARTIGTNEPAVPAYGSTVIVETLRDDKGSYYVRVLHWTGVTEQLVVQTVPGCAELCPVDEFLHLVKDVVPSDEEYQCRDKHREHAIRETHHQHSSALRFYGNWRYILSIVFIGFLLVQT